MYQHSKVTYVTEGLQVRTQGLMSPSQKELQVRVSEPALVPEGEAFLRYVATYLQEQSTSIHPGQTLNYGYWLVKFQEIDDRTLEIWEYNAEGTGFVPGATLSLTYWRDQQLVCRQFNALFTPPRADKLAAVSDGVVEGDPVQGVRYPSPEHMSGWWLTTGRYTGDVASLRVEHLYHITAARPDLARFLALPYGFRFAWEVEGRGEGYVWFDEEAVNPA